MILSAQQLFSDDQAITATAVSTNVIDLGIPGTPFGGNQLKQDIGKGTPIPLLIQVTEDFNTLTSVTVTAEVSAAAAMTSPRVLLSETILLADLKAGKQTHVQVVPKDADLRYMAIRYTVTGTAPTTGKFTSGISMGNQD